MFLVWGGCILEMYIRGCWGFEFRVGISLEKFV